LLRSVFIDCSPSTKRNASAVLLFPEPFGPTIAVMGASKRNSLFLENDLKPESVRDFKYIPTVVYGEVHGYCKKTNTTEYRSATKTKLKIPDLVTSRVLCFCDAARRSRLCEPVFPERLAQETRVWQSRVLLQQECHRVYFELFQT